MKKNEAWFQGVFLRWLRENPLPKSAALEYKYVKGGTFNTKQWLKEFPHQFRGLKNSNINGKSVYHKISDQSDGKKPFDAFYLKNADAFLVIYFEKHKQFCMIHIKDLIKKYLPNKTSIKFSELPEFQKFAINKKQETKKKPLTIKI